MIKSFAEMREINVLPFCEKRDGMDYLNWAKCIDLLHENGAEKVYFVPIPNPKQEAACIIRMLFLRIKTGWKTGVTKHGSRL